MLLQCDFYYYSFEYLQPSSSKWPGGSLSHYSPNQTVPSGLRFAKAGFKPMRGTCFHCSYCFDSIASVRLKLSSFSHTEFNTDRYRSLEHIIDRYRNGKDFFDNIHKPFERSKMNETELPRLFKIPEQRERFMYMFNRSSMANVGFRDFNMTIGL
jgi:beta-1,4-mannosyl-glycoprotein beta-1,4-N-acetylglucosaminyltransferase